MSWLLFIDESGHDRKNTPYEVHGGIALPIGALWNFVRDFQRTELESFGARLSEYGSEIKGARLLAKDRFKFASQRAAIFPDEERRELIRSFLDKNRRREPPVGNEFAAYGQASLLMADRVFYLLEKHNAALFASAIPRSAKKPPTAEADEFLRKDHVFLLERFFFFLEREKSHGLLVMDEIGETQAKRFVRRLERYFSASETGKRRTEWIVPVPFFVSSVLSAPIQAADICIYCVNWGFRLPHRKMDAPRREEIARRFGPAIGRLQYRGKKFDETSGQTHEMHGVVFVPDPYTARHA